MSEKIYCGKGKKSNYGRIKLNICIDDIPAQYISEYNCKRYARLEVSEMRNVDKRNNTHTITVDTWKPTQKPSAPTQHDGGDPSSSDDLPF